MKKHHSILHIHEMYIEMVENNCMELNLFFGKIYLIKDAVSANLQLVSKTLVPVNTSPILVAFHSGLD